MAASLVKNADRGVPAQLEKYRLLEVMKCLAFTSAVFCFDSFYFITYLCLNEEKKNLIPASKEICTSNLCSLFYKRVF